MAHDFSIFNTARLSPSLLSVCDLPRLCLSLFICGPVCLHCPVYCNNGGPFALQYCTLHFRHICLKMINVLSLWCVAVYLLLLLFIKNDFIHLLVLAYGTQTRIYRFLHSSIMDTDIHFVYQVCLLSISAFVRYFLYLYLK